MALYENVLTVLILLGILLLGYAKMMNKTLLEIFQEIKEMFVGKTEDLDLKW